MEIIQINGQRIWGPPSNWLGPPPPHGTEIFIKNIPDDVSEMELHQIFSAAGKVYEVRLPVHWSGINRGYAFVRFTRITEADAAIKRLDRYQIRTGRHIKVERSIDNTRLFLSAVPTHKSGKEIKKDLLTVVDNVKKVYVYTAWENPSLFRGYAFVEFNCHRDAAIAKRILTPDVCFNLFEKKCIAAWANPLPFLNQDILETINILFMRNIPKDMKSVTVKNMVDLLLSPDTVQKVKRLNDFAFLTFRSHESAKRAMHIIKNHPFVLGQHSEVQIEWAVPRELASAASFEMKENEKPEQNFLQNRENNASILRTIQDYVSFKNFNLVEPEDNSEESRTFPMKQDVNIFNVGPQRRLGHFPNLNVGAFTQTRKEKAQIPRLSELPQSQVHGNYQNVKFDIHEDPSPVRNPSSYGEFCPRETEASHRVQHLKHWLENLICPPCTLSPTLTSSSADSVTNLSWKYDDSTNQSKFSGGSGFPVDCDLKSDWKMWSAPPLSQYAAHI